MSPRRAWAVPALLLLLPALAAAATHRVPEDFPLIQSAIDAAAMGDSILVGPGTYDENLWSWGDLVLLGVTGPEATIVDGGRRGHVMILEGGLVEGFTFRNGQASQGAGIYVMALDPITVRNCVVRDNDALTTGGLDPSGEGGGICFDYGFSSPVLVESNVIAGNVANEGGGVWCAYPGATIRDNLISGNTAVYGSGGGVAMMSGLLLRNRIVGNAHDGVAINSGICRSNTIVGNQGVGVVATNGNATIDRNIVARNVRGFCGAAGATLECNDSWGNELDDYHLATPADTTGRHNLSADPLFCGPDDYHVSTESPCVGTGACGLIGALPAACGVTAVRRITWGALKGAYR